MTIERSTIFVGVYGTIRRHSWVDPRALGEDAYSLFVSRAVSMGWSSTGSNGLAADLWGMNDAGQVWSDGDSPARLAWYQVGLPDHSHGPLPIQPITACVHDSLSRVGEVTLTAAQFFLPAAATGSAQANLLSGMNGFGVTDPDAAVTVRVTIGAARNSGLVDRAEAVRAILQRPETGPFAVESFSVDVSVAVRPEPPVVGEMWTVRSGRPSRSWCRRRSGPSTRWGGRRRGSPTPAGGPVCRRRCC